MHKQYDLDGVAPSVKFGKTGGRLTVTTNQISINDIPVIGLYSQIVKGKYNSINSGQSGTVDLGVLPETYGSLVTSVTISVTQAWAGMDTASLSIGLEENTADYYMPSEAIDLTQIGTYVYTPLTWGSNFLNIQATLDYTGSAPSNGQAIIFIEYLYID